MGLGDIIGGVLKPLGKLVDDLHTSSEEKLELKAKLAAIEAELAAKALEHERTLAQEQGATIRAEATGHSWMQRNWRPLVMLMFAYIIFNNYVLSPYFGIPSLDPPPDLWSLIKIGLGGYVVGRSAEKIVPGVVEALKKKEN